MIPQRDALRLQLAAIGGDEPTSSFIEIRPLDRALQPVLTERAFVPVRELHETTTRCLALADRFNVYVGAAPRVREEGTAGAVERVWTLWADCDGTPTLERLRDFRPLPSIVVRSGNDDHGHAYWPLRVAVPAAWAQRANRRLAVALGADSKSTDPARILRAAGTLNHKHAPPRPVVCTRLELDVFTFAEVVGGLSDPPEFVSRPQRETRPTGSPSGALAGAARKVREAAVGERNHLLNWAAYALAPRVASGELSENEVRDELLDAAVAAGLGEREALRTIASGLGRRGVAA